MSLQKGRYLTVLRAKQGEFWAAKNLATSIWSDWNPLFQVTLAAPKDKQTPREAALEGFTAALDEMVDCSPLNSTIFLEVDAIAEYLSDNGAETALKFVAGSSRICVPTLTLSTPDPAKAAFARLGAEAFALHVSPELIWDEKLSTEINRFLRETGLKALNGFLLLDFGGISQGNPKMIARTLPTLIGGITSIQRWRSVTIIASGIPPSLVNPVPFEITVVPRGEMEVWAAALKLPVKRVDLGDYGVSSPDSADEYVPGMAIAPKLIYTTDDSWLWQKSYTTRPTRGKPRGDWNVDVGKFARKLIEHAEFKGDHYSTGDRDIAQFANGARAKANALSVKKIATNHHLTLAARQVAKLIAA